MNKQFMVERVNKGISSPPPNLAEPEHIRYPSPFWFPSGAYLELLTAASLVAGLAKLGDGGINGETNLWRRQGTWQNLYCLQGHLCKPLVYS